MHVQNFRRMHQPSKDARREVMADVGHDVVEGIAEPFHQRGCIWREYITSAVHMHATQVLGLDCNTPLQNFHRDTSASSLCTDHVAHGAVELRLIVQVLELNEGPDAWCCGDSVLCELTVLVDLLIFHAVHEKAPDPRRALHITQGRPVSASDDAGRRLEASKRQGNLMIHISAPSPACVHFRRPT